MSGLTGATLDARAEVVRAAGGCLWSDVSRVAAPAGLAAMAVTTASIGVAGSVLAGGVGWLSRRHGLASESVRAVELVTGDGRVARADADHERDLFWALRGGGGGLGVVTAVELAVIATGTMHAGVFRGRGATPPTSCTPGARGPTALRARRRASRGSSAAAPSVDGYVEAVVLDGRGERGAARLVARARPGARHVRRVRRRGARPPALRRPGRRPVRYDHLLLDQLPHEAVDALLDVAGPAARFPMLDVELRHLGGALNDRGRDCGALGALDADYLLVVAADPSAAQIAGDVVDAMSPWAAGHIFPSFAGAETAEDDVFVSASLRRLAAVKALYDREDRFTSALVPSPVR